MSIRIVIADDHAIVRKGIKADISQSNDLMVVGEAATFDQAFQMIQEINPDVVIFDIQVAGVRAAETIRHIKALEKQVRVIVFTTNQEPALVLKVMQAGADGYLLKNDETFSIPDAVQRVMNGQSCISSSIAEILFGQIRDLNKSVTTLAFTEKEKQVLKHLAEGWSNKEISQKTGMALRTVEAHLSKIYGKLGTTSRAKVVLWAKEKGLI